MQLRYLSLPLIFAYSRIQSLLCIEYYYNYASRCENIVCVWTEVLCDYLKYSHPSGTLWNAIEVRRSLKFESVQLTCIIVRHGARGKKGHQLTGRYSKTWEWWVLFQTNRSKQGRLVRHLPPLKGTTCLLLFHLPASPGTLSEDLNVTIYILFLYPLYHTLSLCC